MVAEQAAVLSVTLLLGPCDRLEAEVDVCCVAQVLSACLEQHRYPPAIVLRQGTVDSGMESCLVLCHRREPHELCGGLTKAAHPSGIIVGELAACYRIICDRVDEGSHRARSLQSRLQDKRGARVQIQTTHGAG